MERAETQLAALGTSVREMLALECPAGRAIRQARAEFLHHVVAHDPATPPWPRARGLLLAGLTAAAAIGLWAWVRLPITFKVGAAGARGQAGDLLSASTTTPAPVRFSDGTSVLIREGGRLRVLTTDRKGARVLVEDGTVDVSVAPGRFGKKRWSFEAGPFSVLVTGTKFELSYRERDQSFDLLTRQGEVIVSGPCLKQPTPVGAGSRIDLACLDKSSPSRPAPAPSPPALAPQKSADLSSASASPVRGATWRELLAVGRLQDGLRAAERSGFDRVCQTATNKELLLLADGARLFDRTERALVALQVLRQRFPSAPEAATAAFTLGRIAFEHKHAYGEAAAWFAAYLREDPNGPLMGDAVGRLMEARLRAGDESGARFDATRYLRRFPEGPYATQARGILSR